ncbi:MAG: YraN family protein [Verrucomicrobiae bacterium]
MVRVPFIAAVLRRLRKPPAPEAGHIRLGREGEEAAVRHLRGNGYKILRRNFRAPHGGEVDIVCRHGNELVFVEVKTRSAENFGRPFEAVDAKKRSLIIRGAMKWLRLLGMPDITFRFDVVEVVTFPDREIRIIENAFQLPDNYSY